MKILWIVPITGPDEARLGQTASFLNQHAFPGTEVTVRKVSRGTESIESRLDEAYAALPTVEEVLRAEREGFDACVVGCAGDAGVSLAKETAKIPVIGPLEASLSISRLVGRKAVFVTTLPERVPSVEERIAGLVPRHQFVIQPVNMAVLEIPRDPGRTVKALIGIVERCRDLDRADHAILGCLSMRGMAEPVQERVKVPVIDPSLAALSMAQCLARLGLSHSKQVFPFPGEKKRSL